MPLLTSIVDLDCIRVDSSESTFDPEKHTAEIEALAYSVLKLEGLVKVPVVRLLEIDEYELVDGFLEYYAFLKARQLNPDLPDRITVFIMKASNEEAILKQVEVNQQLAQLSTVSEPSNSEVEVDGKLGLQFRNLESKVDQDFKDFGIELQKLKNELLEEIDSKLPKFLPLLDAFNKVKEDLVRKKIVSSLSSIKVRQPDKVVEVIQRNRKEQGFESFSDILNCLEKGMMSPKKMLELIDKWQG